MNTKELFMKSVLTGYWRFEKRLPMVSIEVSARLSNSSRGDRADILAITKDNYLIQTEIKTSLQDLKNDIKKKVHRDCKDKIFAYPMHYFYFAVPEEILPEAREIVQELFLYAGILVVSKNKPLGYPYVYTSKVAKQFRKPKVSKAQINVMNKSMSSSICRLLQKLI